MITLVDPYGRLISSLRNSLTQRCNFNCFFCHHEGEHVKDQMRARNNSFASLGTVIKQEHARRMIWELNRR